MAKKGNQAPAEQAKANEQHKQEGVLVNALRALLAEASNTQDHIKAADKVVKEGKSSISGKLLALAKQADNVQQFLQACDTAEHEYKEASKGKRNGRAATIPTCWTQAKSNIKAGWSMGIDPKEYETESEFRKETNTKRKAAKDAAAEDGNLTVRVPKEIAALTKQFVAAFQIAPGATNAIAVDALAKLDQVLAAALPKGEPVAQEQQKAA